MQSDFFSSEESQSLELSSKMKPSSDLTTKIVRYIPENCTNTYRDGSRLTAEGEALETAAREDEAEAASVDGNATAAVAKVAVDDAIAAI